MIQKRGQRLVGALEALQKADPRLTENALARAAGVAPKTLKSVMAQTFVLHEGRPPSQVDPGTKIDARQKRAWAEALTRLAIYVSRQSPGEPIEPEDAADEAGLSRDDREVVLAIERVKSGQKARLGLSDEVLDNIAARSKNDEHRKRADFEGASLDGLVRAGVLRWDPFFSPSDQLHDSWGFKFCRRLLGSLNPTRWWIDVVPETSIHGALRTLAGGIDSSDLVFGLYDTVSRRLAGYDFINIPGIGVPLDAIFYIAPGQERSAPTWAAIANPKADSNERFYATVLEGEVGELYLRGPCQYPPRDIHTLNVFDPGEIARRLVVAPGPSDRIPLVVADRPTCLAVLTALGKIAAGDVGTKDAATALAFRSVGAESGLEKSVATAPVYRLGIAIRAGAKPWKELLNTALVEELFRNDYAWSVQHYLSLISQSYDKLALLPLEPQLPTTVARTLARQFWDDIQKRQKEIKDFPRLRHEFRHMWDIDNFLQSDQLLAENIDAEGAHAQ